MTDMPIKECLRREELIDLIEVGIDDAMDVDTNSRHWAVGAADNVIANVSDIFPEILNAQISAARDAALEEAALVVNKMLDQADFIATRIRAMKGDTND